MKNNHGVTLIEVMIASVILVFFAVGLFRAFSGSRTYERINETSFNAYAVGSSILDNFVRFQGTGTRRNSTYVLSTGYDSFETLDTSGQAFYAGTQHNISEVDTAPLDNYAINTADYQFNHNITPTIEYTVTDYTGNIYATSGAKANDGFRMVTVNVEWEDSGLDTLL